MAGAVAATLPARAEAGDTPVSAPDSAVLPSPAVDPAALVEEASDAVESATSVAVADPQAGTTDAPPVGGTQVPSTVAEDAEPAPETGIDQEEAPDTMPIEADTSDGIAAPAATLTARPAPVVQAAPANVNVSVRIDSAGDDGPVTQTNTVTVASARPAGAGNAAASPSTSAAGVAKAGQEPPVAAPAVAAATGSPAEAKGDPGTWSWQWNCLSSPDLTAISPISSGSTSMPTNWTWIWNCGENAGQYQSGTGPQYQPSNVNVSIRVASPGSNGPVSQVNVTSAAGTTIAPVAVTGGPVKLPVNALPIPASSVGALVSAILPPVAAAVLVDPVPEEILTDAGADAVSTAGLALGVVEVPELLSPLLTGVTSALAPSRRLPSIVARPAAPVGLLPPVARLELAAPAVVETLSKESTRDASQATASDAGDRAQEKPVPRWKAPRPQPVPDVAPAGASAAPATGGGSAGGGIPIFLALPFLAAMLDLARRVMLDRVALPSGFRSRMPENPG